MIRVGLLGRGMAATGFHAPLMRAVSGIEVVAIAGSADATAVLADPGVDVVVIATPNATHFELARAALENGKHVVIDKPFVTSLEEADCLAALAARQQRILTAFHNRRWDGDFLTVRDIVNSGRLGDIALYEAYWDRFRPNPAPTWKESPGEGGGLLWNLGPHLVDQMLMLFGFPDAIQADLASQRDGATVEDYFCLTFSYGRRRAVLSASTLVAQPRPRFSVHGNQGSFVKCGLDPQEAALAAGENPLDPGFGEDRPEYFGTTVYANGTVAPEPTRQGRYLSFYEQLAAAVTTGSPAPVDLPTARQGVELIVAALRSAACGMRVKLASSQGPA